MIHPEELALIDGASIVLSEGVPCLVFTMRLVNGGAMETIPITGLARFLAQGALHDVRSLNGMPIVVQCTNGRYGFVRFYNRNRSYDPSAVYWGEKPAGFTIHVGSPHFDLEGARAWLEAQGWERYPYGTKVGVDGYRWGRPPAGDGSEGGLMTWQYMDIGMALSRAITDLIDASLAALRAHQDAEMEKALAERKEMEERGEA